MKNTLRNYSNGNYWAGTHRQLKIKTEDTKVWLSRMTVDDGMPYNNMVIVEKLINGKWETIEEYQAEIHYHNGAIKNCKLNFAKIKIKWDTGKK